MNYIHNKVVSTKYRLQSIIKIDSSPNTTLFQKYCSYNKKPMIERAKGLLTPLIKFYSLPIQAIYKITKRLLAKYFHTLCSSSNPKINVRFFQ